MIDFTLLIPSKDEYNNLKMLFEKLIIFKDIFDIIIVDDSKDFEGMINLRKKYSTLNLKVIKGPNKGVGKAISIGIKEIRTKFFIIMMADLSDDPRILPNIIHKLKNGNQIVFTNRFIKGAVIKDYPLVKFVYNRLTNMIIKFLFLLRTSDITGAYNGYQTEYFNKLTFHSEGFSIFVELPLLGIKQGLNYSEVPGTWYNRIEGKSNMKLLKSGFEYFALIFRIFFNFHEG